MYDESADFEVPSLPWHPMDILLEDALYLTEFCGVEKEEGKTKHSNPKYLVRIYYNIYLSLYKCMQKIRNFRRLAKNKMEK